MVYKCPVSVHLSIDPSVCLSSVNMWHRNLKATYPNFMKLNTCIVVSYDGQMICILLVKIRFKLFDLRHFVTKIGVCFFHMSHCISKTILDYGLKLYTCLCYIHLKICILFGDDSKFYFWVIEYFVKQGSVFLHVALYLKNNLWLLLKTLHTSLLY